MMYVPAALAKKSSISLSLIFCFIITLSFCSIFNPLSRIGDALNLESVEDMVILMSKNSEADSTAESAVNLQVPAQNMLVVNDTIDIKRKKVEPICRILKESKADYCEIEGDVRIDPNSSTIFVVVTTDHQSINNSSSSYSRSIQPYPRKKNPFVKNWTIALIAADNNTIPKCDQTHNLPAILFSVGGWSGNYFHDFADLILPLYTTSFRFHKEVHFLASDYERWSLSQFRDNLLKRLSRHELVDIDREKKVHCYNTMVAGLQFHKELIINPSEGISMYHFRKFLRQTYSLNRTKAMFKYWEKASSHPPPRLMIVSRKRTRTLTNELQLSRVAAKLGYEVVLADTEATTDLTKFAQIVNSCDVLMGIHGAGLTNMVFLPDNAILIQVVPLGGIGMDGYARLDFGDPAPHMNIRYLEYKITVEESSLSQHYPMDHPFLTNPLSFQGKGWVRFRNMFLDNQNITIDIRRFKPYLVKALNLLHR
ncbi:hypothetical protein BUALT_Bualt07G0083700 [Buddleja alternifolia]|uniref:Glycosyltransferase 61 catalytic domain-containing protein n=1 Tax=Buddleja alternifolia TaxID=168488 RepID=A0AAV6X8F1_9LAMI|nr:hypothetical protein BUALT_Bualt07G0083700 [Buddleja alternifolia]